MQSATAVVRSVSGTVAKIELEAGGCGRCHETGGCGGQGLSRAFCGAPKQFTIDNTLQVQTGDRVRVGIDSGEVRRAATMTYLVPLLALFVGALIGAPLGSAISAVLGFGGLGAAWWWLTTSKKNDLAPPVMIERLPVAHVSGPQPHA